MNWLSNWPSYWANDRVLISISKTWLISQQSDWVTERLTDWRTDWDGGSVIGLAAWYFACDVDKMLLLLVWNSLTNLITEHKSKSKGVCRTSGGKLTGTAWDHIQFTKSNMLLKCLVSKVISRFFGQANTVSDIITFQIFYPLKSRSRYNICNVTRWQIWKSIKLLYTILQDEEFKWTDCPTDWLTVRMAMSRCLLPPNDWLISQPSDWLTERLIDWRTERDGDSVVGSLSRNSGCNVIRMLLSPVWNRLANSTTETKSSRKRVLYEWRQNCRDSLMITWNN